MKRALAVIAVILLVLAAFFLLSPKENRPSLITGTTETSYCLTGAFLGDRPSERDILKFREDYGKAPYLVMVFTDWGRFADNGTLKAIYSSGSVPFITWEPWKAYEKEPIDYEGLLEGKYDKYISDFAGRLKSAGKPVYLRFAHEMNGDWYPWAGTRIGAETYKAMYRHVKDTFDAAGADNVIWVFSVNREDVPPTKDNRFMLYYPGDKYVDYIGIDGYNWGNTRSWSRWMTFSELFRKSYEEATGTGIPVIISEFSSAKSGGDKAVWIKDAMADIKNWKDIRAFVLFNVNKEADWSFPIGEVPGKELRRQLEDPYFRDREAAT
jgi:mannan endo-1,4-beta-mannosidase